MSNVVFDDSALRRSVLSGEALQAFKREARMHIVNDDLTGYSARIFIHDDGRMLVDSIGYNPRVTPPAQSATQ